MGFLKGDEVSLLLSRCAPPSTDVSTAYDNPRPPLVTRILTWRDQNLRLVYTPKGAVVGQGPPYAGWTLLFLFDPANEVHLTPAQAAKRLQAVCR